MNVQTVVLMLQAIEQNIPGQVVDHPIMELTLRQILEMLNERGRPSTDSITPADVVAYMRDHDINPWAGR